MKRAMGIVLDVLLVGLALVLAAGGMTSGTLSAIQGVQALTAAIFLLLLDWYLHNRRGQ